VWYSIKWRYLWCPADDSGVGMCADHVDMHPSLLCTFLPHVALRLALWTSRHNVPLRTFLQVLRNLYRAQNLSVRAEHGELCSQVGLC
jgi:hypothetical protein